MLVAHYTGPRKIQLVEEPKPQIRDPREVLLRIDRLGVCGSDVHYYVHGHIGDQRLEYPASFGHECAGTIEQVGSAVEGLAPGDRVAVDPAFACGQCDQCRTHRPNTCRDLRFMGNPGEAPGAAAQWRVIPAENCLPVPDAVSLDEALLLEPLSIGLYAVQMAEVYPAARVGIFGVGPIGLSVLMFCQALGPPIIYVTDLLDYRLQAAEKLGADWTGNPKKTDIVREIRFRERFGLDVVFECSGDPACIDQALEVLVPGGALLLVGIPIEERVSFNIHRMRRNEVVFYSVRRQADCMRPALDAIEQGAVDPTVLVTHHFPFARISEAFELVAEYGNGVIKAIVDVNPNA